MNTDGFPERRLLMAIVSERIYTRRSSVFIRVHLWFLAVVAQRMKTVQPERH